MKILKSLLIPANLGYIRFKRSKSSSIVFFSAITLSITFTIGITVGTKYLQATILESDLNDVMTDICVGIALPDGMDNPNLNQMTNLLTDFAYVEKTIVKYKIRDLYRGGNDSTHQFGVDRNSVSTFEKIGNTYPNILCFNSSDFREYTDVFDIELQDPLNALLTTNTTIISSYLARKLNVTLNETIFIHYINYGSGSITSDYISNKSFPLKITNILPVSSESKKTKDLVRDPLFQGSGIINQEFLIVESETFLTLVGSLMENDSGIVTNNFILSLFLHRSSIVDSYNTVKSPVLLQSLENEVVTTLLQNLPQGTIVSTQNMLLDALGELNDDVVKLQQTLTIISIPIISLVLVITLLSRISSTNKQVYQHGLLICRGLSRGAIKVSFLIEGIIVGFFAVIGGILTSFMFISAFYFVIPSDKDYFQWLYVFFNNGPSIVINSLFLGFILGFGLNYIVFRNISKFKPIETIYQTQSEMTYWFHKPQKDVNLILLIIVSIIIIWILQQSTHLNEILGRYRNLLLLFDDFVSILRLILPILIVLLLTRIVTNRREILSRYMLLFAFFLNSTIKNIIHLNSLRRPKHLSTLAFITAIAFSMGITPIILSYSAYDVSIRQLKREVGSDIRITGSYSQLEDFVPSSFYNLSSHIKAVTSLVWVDGLIVMENRTSGLNELNIGVNYLPTGLLAIEPDNYVEVAYFEDCFISDNNPKELFTKLSSDVATAVAPVSFKNFETYPNEYIQYNIGSVLPIQFDFTDNERIFVNFSVVGFFYLIPGFIQNNFNPPLPLICSREYLESLNITHRLYLSWEDPLMSWLIKIDPSADSAIRRSVFKNLNEYFHDFEVVFIDNVVRSFLVTPTGSVVVVMDAIFFVVLILTLFGLSLVFLQTFNERTTEIAIYRSRGMRMREIRQMFLFEILSIDVLGVIFGVIIGLVTSLTYIDILITPNPRIPVNLLFPEVKLVTFIGLQILIHIILILGLSFWSGKHNILRNLRVID